MPPFFDKPDKEKTLDRLKTRISYADSSNINPDPAGHKQIFFPISNDKYHLISPLYSSSLCQYFFDKREEINFPQLGMLKLGGKKLQNISALNVERSGELLLLE